MYILIYYFLNTSDSITLSLHLAGAAIIFICFCFVASSFFGEALSSFYLK